MTATVNGHRPDVTVGDGVRVCVRASENPAQAAKSASDAQGSVFTPVHTRVIPQESDIRPPRRASKVRNFASPHVGDAKAAVTGSWFGREHPPAFFDTARVWPAPGEAGNWAVWTVMTAAGLLRLAALAVIYLAAFCFATRIRTTTSTAVLLCAYAAHTWLP